MADIRAAKRETVPIEDRAEHSQPDYPKVISVRYDKLLHQTVQNMVDSSLAAGDFTFTSHTHVVRLAMDKWVSGMEITEDYVKGKTQQAAYHVSEVAYDKYYEIPKMHRSRQFQRIIKTYLKNLQGG